MPSINRPNIGSIDWCRIGPIYRHFDSIAHRSVNERTMHRCWRRGLDRPWSTAFIAASLDNLISLPGRRIYTPQW